MFLENWWSNHEVKQYVAACGWNLGALNLGIYFGWAAVANPKLQSTISPELGVPLTDEEISYCTALPFIVAMMFAMVWGYIANRFGRKVTGSLNALCVIVCYSLILNTHSVEMMIVSRIIGGIAYIPALFNGPMYIAEIAESQKLGRLSSTYLIIENFGTLLIFIIGGHTSFKFLNIFSTVCGFIFLFAINILPESPVFYLKQDRYEEAKQSLQFFRPKNNDSFLENELQRLNETFVLSKKMKWKYLLSRHTLMALFIALYLQFGVQMSGINYVSSYTVSIFQRSKTIVAPYNAIIIAGVFHSIAPFLYFTITNILGRKTITIASYALQSLVWGSLGWYYFYIENNSVDNSSPVNYLPVVCISLYFLTYSAGAGCIPFTLYGEIFSSEVRNTVMPFIYVWNALLSFFVIKLAPTLLYQTIHMSGVFWLFSACCMLTVVFAIVFIPETKDKTFLTVIDDLTNRACW